MSLTGDRLGIAPGRTLYALASDGDAQALGHPTIRRGGLQGDKQRLVPQIRTALIVAAKGMLEGQLHGVGVGESTNVKQGASHGRDPQAVDAGHLMWSEVRPNGRGGAPC